MKRYIALCSILLVCWLHAEVKISQPNAQQMQVHYTIPSYEIVQQGDYSLIKVSGMEHSTQAGEVDLPRTAIQVAVPANGQVQVSIQSQQTVSKTLSNSLIPVARTVHGKKVNEYLYEPNKQYIQTRPANPIKVNEPQTFRNVRFVTVEIAPFQYNAQTKELLTYTDITLQIDISGKFDPTPKAIDELSSTFLSTMANAPHAGYNFERKETPTNYINFAKAPRWIKLEINKDGIYALTYNQLTNLSLQTVSPQSIRMFSTGSLAMSTFYSNAGNPIEEIPLLIEGGEDGRFDEGDKIIFFAQNRDGVGKNNSIIDQLNYNSYSGTGVYWLAIGGSYPSAPLRINTLSSTVGSVVRTNTPATLRVESEKLKRVQEGVDWYSSLLAGSYTASYHYDATLTNVDAITDTTLKQTFQIGMREEYNKNGSSKTHRYTVDVNSKRIINQLTWYGDAYFTGVKMGNFLVSGTNGIDLTIHRSGNDNIFLDYYQLSYYQKLIKEANTALTIKVRESDNAIPVTYQISNLEGTTKVFKVTTFKTVEQVPLVATSSRDRATYSGSFSATGSSITKYLVVGPSDYLSVSAAQEVSPVDLTKVLTGVEAIIITPTEFASQAETLKQYYQGKLNKVVAVINYNDIFNQFNCGMHDPSAIRNYIRYVWQSDAGRSLATITLLGSGTYDWRNFSGSAQAKNRFPIFQKSYSADSGMVSDDYYVMLSQSSYPELAIGRYPAKTTDQLDFMITRMKQYTESPLTGWWKNTMLMMADDEFNGTTTGEYYHSTELENTSQQVNRSVLVDKIFALEYAYDSFQNKPEARADLINAINEGRLVWYYSGHGSYDQLGSEDYFRGAIDIPLLTNQRALPLFIAASCDVGELDAFSFDCLAEKLVYATNGGAIASFAATRLSNGTSNSQLINYLFEKAINLRLPIGESVQLAKVLSLSNGNDETYILFGDPLLSIVPPERADSIEILPSQTTYQARQTLQFRGTFSQAVNGTADVRVLDSDPIKQMKNGSSYTHDGQSIYRINADVINGAIAGRFIVPDDIVGGTTGRAIALYTDQESGKELTTYIADVQFRGHDYVADNPDAPAIKIWLDEESFQDGSAVSQNPTLYATVADSNGINILGKAGHKIIAVIDNATQTFDLTDAFNYDSGSYTTGKIVKTLDGLTEGSHRLQMLVYDNFNRPSMAEISFVVTKSASVAIKDLLPYPNPMKKDGYITFSLSSASDVTITFYTMTGRKIRTIKQNGLSAGYQQIYWDGKDQDGDRLANNTYFFKVKAKSLKTGKSAEKTERVIIFN